MQFTVVRSLIWLPVCSHGLLLGAPWIVVDVLGSHPLGGYLSACSGKCGSWRADRSSFNEPLTDHGRSGRIRTNSDHEDLHPIVRPHRSGGSRSFVRDSPVVGEGHPAVAAGHDYGLDHAGSNGHDDIRSFVGRSSGLWQSYLLLYGLRGSSYQLQVGISGRTLNRRILHCL